MGTYVYRVTAKRVKLSNGEEANVAVFAYKPYWSPRSDRKMHFSSGALASDRMAERGNLCEYIVMGDDNRKPYLPSRVYRNTAKVGTFYDGDEPGGNMFPPVDVRLKNEPHPEKT